MDVGPVDENEVFEFIFEELPSRMRTFGLDDNVWILFVLEGIADYCTNKGLHESSHLVSQITVPVENEIIQKSKKSRFPNGR